MKMLKMKAISDSCEDLRINQTRSSNLASQRSMAASVPDSLDKIADDGVSLGSLGSRLWLDGSPPISQRNQVYPHNSPPPVADVSWEEAPTAMEEGREEEEEVAREQGEVLSHTQIGLSQIPHAKERHHSLQLKDEDLRSSTPPAPDDDGALFSSKGLSRSLENLVSNNSDGNQQQRPVPKPRKERSQTSAPVLETESRSQEEPSRPRTLPDLLLSPMRPRNNSEPPSIRPRKASHSRSKKGSRKSRGGSRKLSPPSTPPPPPPPLNEDEDAAPPPPSQLSLSYSTLNRPTFVPPPPPAADE